MNNILDVITSDGNSYQIKIIKTFQLDSYPNKKYIAYTFGEEVNEINEGDLVIVLETDADEDGTDIVIVL